MMMMMVDGEDFTCERTLVRLFTSMNLNTDTVYAVSSGFFLSLSLPPFVRSFCAVSARWALTVVSVYIRAAAEQAKERERSITHVLLLDAVVEVKSYALFSPSRSLSLSRARLFDT